MKVREGEGKLEALKDRGNVNFKFITTILINLVLIGSTSNDTAVNILYDKMNSVY